MTAAMSEVGWLFEEGEYFVPEMLIVAQQLDELITPIGIKLHSNCTEEESNKTK